MVITMCVLSTYSLVGSLSVCVGEGGPGRDGHRAGPTARNEGSQPESQRAPTYGGPMSAEVVGALREPPHSQHTGMLLE